MSIPAQVIHNGKTYRVLSKSGSMYRLDNHMNVPISDCVSLKLGPKVELGEFKIQDPQAALDALPSAPKPKAKAKK